MRRRYALPVTALLVCAAFLVACGGSKVADTPVAVAPTAAPTTAAASVPSAATRPAGSAVTGSSAVPTAPTVAVGSASAPAGTRAVPSAATGSTPAPTTAAGSAPAVTGTRPTGSITTGSAPAGTIAVGSVAAGAGETLFTDPRGRFSFARPAAWTVGQSTAAGSVVQFDATNPPGVVDISTESVSSGITPGTYLGAALIEIKKGIPDAQQVGTTQMQLDSEPAIQIDYTGTVSGNKIAFSQIFALHKGTAYILTLGAQPADSDAFKQQASVVLRTWKFLQ